MKKNKSKTVVPNEPTIFKISLASKEFGDILSDIQNKQMSTFNGANVAYAAYNNGNYNPMDTDACYCYPQPGDGVNPTCNGDCFD